MLCCIDPGGSRGYASTLLLDKLQQSGYLQQVTRYVGLSIGGIIALHGATKDEKETFASLFEPAKLPRVCQRSVWDNLMGPIQFEPVYDGRMKRQVLKDIFADKQIKIPVTLGAYNMNTSSLDQLELTTMPLWKMADATSACPCYFPPVKFESSVYIDGAMIGSNAVAYAYELFHEEMPDMKIISLGSCLPDLPPYSETKTWTMFDWLTKGYWLHRLWNTRPGVGIPKRIPMLRLEPELGDLLLDDDTPEVRKRIEDEVEKVWAREQDSIINFFNS